MEGPFSYEEKEKNMIPQQTTAVSPSIKKPSMEVLRPALERNKYLGGTDAAAICGMSRRKSILQIWAEKTGKIQPEDISSLWHIRLGRLYEDDVCQIFMEETGKKVHRVNETIHHPKYPFLAANVDRRVVGEDAILEAKTATEFLRHEWEGEDIPADYIFQCFHYLMVTGKKRCYLAVAIGKTDFKIKIIERDEKVLASLLEREIEFWTKYVEPDVMPTVISHMDGDLLSQLYPVANEAKEIALGDEANILVENLKAFEADKRNLERIIEEKKNELKVLLGDAASGTTGINQVRWVNYVQNRLDGKGLLEKYPAIHKEFYKASAMRRFSYGPIKKNGAE